MTDTGTDGAAHQSVRSVDLDELEAKARAAAEAVARFAAGWPSDDVDDANLAFCAAADPDTILDLIERVRAGEELYELIREVAGTETSFEDERLRYVEIQVDVDVWKALPAARERWESLTHSPQEAGA